MFEKIFTEEELKVLETEGEKFKETFQGATPVTPVDLGIPKFKI
jgi:hypothetical protein